MTEEQEKRVLDNQNLIYIVLKKYNLYKRLDEYYDLAMIGLCKGAKSYDKTKGFSESTYLYRCIENELRMEFRKKKIKATISLESETIRNNDRALTLLDVIPDERVNIEEDFFHKYEMEMLQEKIQALEDNEKTVIKKKYFSDEKNSQSKIAEVLNVSQPHVSRIKKTAIDKLKRMMKND